METLNEMPRLKDSFAVTFPNAVDQETKLQQTFSRICPGGGGGGMQYVPKDSKQHIEHDSMTLAKGATTGGSWAFQRRKHLG